MKSAEELIATYRDEGIDRVTLGLADVDGVLRGKRISLEGGKRNVRRCVYRSLRRHSRMGGA